MRDDWTDPSNGPFWVQGLYPFPAHVRNRSALTRDRRTWTAHGHYRTMETAIANCDALGKGVDGDRINKGTDTRIIDIRTGKVVYPEAMAGQEATHEGSSELPVYALQAYGKTTLKGRRSWVDHERSITLKDAKASLKHRVNTDPYDPLDYDTRWRIVDIRDGTVVAQADWIGDTKRPAKIQATAAKLKQAAKLLEAAAKMKTLKGCALKEQEAHAILSRLRHAGEID